MLNNVTLSQLRDMGLSTMASCFKEQQDKSGIGSLSFEERFGLLVEAEWLSRRNSRINRLIKHGSLPFLKILITRENKALPNRKYSS